MKILTIVISSLLIATSATAGGIYNDRLSSPAVVATANTPTTLWTTNIAGGAISAGDAMLLHARVIGASGTGSLDVKLGSQVLYTLDGITSGNVFALDLRVTRTGTTTSTISGTLALADVAGPVELGYITVSGLAWTSAQTLSLVGETDTSNGVVLDHAGIQR